MTNAKVPRKDVLSEEEVRAMINKAKGLTGEYSSLRSQALISLFRSGKRRQEIATLEMTRAHHAEIVCQRSDKDEWTVRAAKTVEEATELVSVGFEYVTEVEGFKLFKKRK